MRPSRRSLHFRRSLAALAVLVVAGPAFARGGIDRQAGQAAFVKGSYRAGQAHCLRIAGSRPVHLVVLGRMPEAMSSTETSSTASGCA